MHYPCLIECSNNEGKLHYGSIMDASEQEILSVILAGLGLGPQADTASMFTCYAEELLAFDVTAPTVYDGLDSFRQTWQGTRNDDRAIPRVDVMDMRIHADSTLAYATCLLNVLARDGASLMQAPLRATFCLRRSDGRWRIVHQHISRVYDESDD